MFFGRQAKPTITPAARQMHEKISKHFVMWEVEIFDILKHDEREHLREILRKLALYALGLAR